MLIIKMIKRITNLNQNELAEFLGVSRASINLWENTDGKMSTYVKNTISEKFNIPFELLDDEINNDLEKCKKLYSYLSTKWYEMNKTKVLNDEDILNKVEFEINKENFKKEITDYEVMEALTNGYNPYTGEVFPDDHILNDNNIKKILTDIKLKNFKYEISYNDLTPIEKQTFNELKKWRKEMAYKEGFFSAYMVFTNKELINIVTANVNNKEDLLKVKGIAQIKYAKYGNDLFNILNNQKYNYVKVV